MSRVALLALCAILATACAHGRRPASYRPIGAPAQYGDSTMDGVVLMLTASEDRARRAIVEALRSTGVELTPLDQTGGSTVVVFTGRFNVPSRRIRDAWIIQRPGESNPLYRRLGAIADSTRKFIAASP